MFRIDTEEFYHRKGRPMNLHPLIWDADRQKFYFERNKKLSGALNRVSCTMIDPPSLFHELVIGRINAALFSMKIPSYPLYNCGMFSNAFIYYMAGCGATDHYSSKVTVGDDGHLYATRYGLQNNAPYHIQYINALREGICPHLIHVMYDV